MYAIAFFPMRVRFLLENSIREGIHIYMYIDDGWGEENRLSGIQIYERFYDCDSVCVIES